MNSFILRVAIGTVLLAFGTGAAYAQAEERPKGWASESAEEAAEAESASEPFSAEEQKRYDAACRALVVAINAGDKKAYRALFSDAGWESSIEWWKVMFAEQLEGFGKIDKAWAPRRGLMRVGKLGAGNDWGGAAFLVHFEEPMGGVLSLRLDADGKIDRTDVFVTSGLGHHEPEDVELIYPR